MSDTVVGTRTHWSYHDTSAPIDVDSELQQLLQFCERAKGYSNGVLIAFGLPNPAHDSTTPLAASIYSLLNRLTSHALESSFSIHIIPIAYWGHFVPALNAIVSKAATAFPSNITKLILQSVEIEVDVTAITYLSNCMDLDSDLVVGAALPGHSFQASSEPVELNGRTSPWNTLAIWDLNLLTKVGFPLLGEGLRIEGNVAGVEEVATIATYQQLLPSSTCAKLVKVPGISWEAEFQDESRRAWHDRKMKSKNERAMAQMKSVSIMSGHVYHI